MLRACCVARASLKPKAAVVTGDNGAASPPGALHGTASSTSSTTGTTIPGMATAATTAPATTASATTTPAAALASKTSRKSMGRSAAVPLQGIALAALTPLLREHGELSIQDVCVRVVLPAGTTGSYAEHLLSHPSTAALVSAKADVFVSYAWRYTLNQLVSALATHADAAKLFFWIDAFVIDQHAASASHATAEWMALFSGALASIGSAVVVLIPWDKPVPVSRAWCVFEHYALLSQRIRTEALLSPADAADFLRRLKAGLSFDEINAVFTAIDVETSQASRPEDRDAIMTQVRALGVAKVNATASSAVKSFMLARARAEAQSSQDALVFNGLGALLQALGEYDDARAWFVKTVAAARDAHGTDSEPHASALCNLAECLLCLGNASAALERASLALAIRQRLGGKADVAGAFNLVAEAQRACGRLDDAEASLREAMRARPSEDERGSALDQSTLAAVLADAGRKQDAAALWESALKTYARLFPRGHPDVAKMESSLAACLADVGSEPERAAQLRAKAQAALARALGEEHPVVEQAKSARVLARFASVCWSDGMLDDGDDRGE